MAKGLADGGLGFERMSVDREPPTCLNAVMSSFDGPDDLFRAATLVRRACRVTHAVQRQIDALKVMTKDDRSPVTIADFAAQAVIARGLAESPDLRLAAEESAAELRTEAQTELRHHVLEATRDVWPEATESDVLEAIDRGLDAAGAGTFWTLDPIDGTKGFLRNNQYCVSLARIRDGRPEVGVLGCPRLSIDAAGPVDAEPSGVLLCAVRGQGLWEGRLEEDAPLTRVEPPKRNSASGVLRLCESVEVAHSNQETHERIMIEAGLERRSVRLDSQVKYAVVARGQADVYLRIPRRADYVERIWDHAAGALVAQEAGVTVTDLAGQALDFSLGRGLEANRGILVAPSDVHARLVDAVKRLREQAVLP